MRFKLVTAALVCASALLAAAPAGAATLTDRDALEAALVTKINSVRAKHGLRRLKVVRRLASAASRHADSMGGKGYFRHELFTPARTRNWTPFGTWIRWYYPGPGYTSWSAGENLAWGAPELTAAQTVSNWLASAPHRANLLNRSWRNVGIGAVHVRNPAGYYGAWDDVTIVVAEFGRRS